MPATLRIGLATTLCRLVVVCSTARTICTTDPVISSTFPSSAFTSSSVVSTRVSNGMTLVFASVRILVSRFNTAPRRTSAKPTPTPKTTKKKPMASLMISPAVHSILGPFPFLTKRQNYTTGPILPRLQAQLCLLPRSPR
jgi:hypothetical protein